LPKRAIAGIFASIFAGVAVPAHAAECADLWDWLDKGCRRVVDTYENGGNEVMLSGYEWHLPFTYTKEKRDELNSNAWGGGWAKTVEDPNGDTHSVYFLAFLDSHKKVQWNVGYGYTTFWGSRDGLQAGLGYTVFIMQRPDIASGVPIPAALPIASLRYQEATMSATFIPTLNGGINHGSTLYIYGSYRLF
jgi:palmitoyl transferase